MPLTTSECCFPLITLSEPHLVIGVAQIDFGEDLCEVEAIQHFRYEGEGKTIFDSDFIETPVVDDEAQLAIGTRDEHDGSCSWGLGRPDEAISQVAFQVSFHFCQLQG